MLSLPFRSTCSTGLRLAASSDNISTGSCLFAIIFTLDQRVSGRPSELLGTWVGTRQNTIDIDINIDIDIDIFGLSLSRQRVESLSERVKTFSRLVAAYALVVLAHHIKKGKTDCAHFVPAHQITKK